MASHPALHTTIVLLLFVTACTGAEPSGTEARSTSSSPRTTSTTTSPTMTTLSATTTSTRASTTTSTTTTTTAPATTIPRAVRYGLPFAESRTRADLADVILEAETTLRGEGPAPQRVEAGRRVQAAYRQLAVNPNWDKEVFEPLPADIAEVARRNVVAGRALSELVKHELPTDLPAWRIVEPRPPTELMGFYREAADAVGIDWELLAAINLVETRMGRIRGTSTAGAQGPMQFIPSSWEIYGEEGDINDDHDSIFAAARHLVDRAGDPFDVDRALRGYNNHPAYVEAVKAYAANIGDHPGAYLGYHSWEVYFTTTEGVFWLPVGYEETESIPVEEYLDRPVVDAPTDEEDSSNAARAIRGPTVNTLSE